MYSVVICNNCRDLQAAVMICNKLVVIAVAIYDKLVMIFNNKNVVITIYNNISLH